MAKTKAVPKQAKTAEPAKEAYKGATINGIPINDFVDSLDGRIQESKAHFDSVYKLEKVTKENEELYLGGQVTKREDDDQDNLALDNRIFSAIRTIVPYVTRRITEPEVHPSSNSSESKKFAEDFEKALFIHADSEEVKEKTKFALEDAIIRRRGYLKPRYDPATKNFCKIEYVPCESIIVDHKAKGYEEPRYFRHVLDKTVEDLLTMFPENETAIKRVFKIEDNTPYKKYLESHSINEDWAFVPGADGQLDLIVCWNYNKQTLGCIQDPNWLYDEDNFLPHHMMPLVFFNVLNDGRSHIDKTSFVEQAKYSQLTIDKRSEQIGENAGLGSIGMPVVDSEAMAEDQVDYLTFEPDTALEMAVPEGKTINDVFTTWKAGSLPADVYKDKEDAIGAVENAFGASAVLQGNQSDNNTLGQDELLRDQSMGRQMDIVDAIDMAHKRLYMLVAQFLLVYGEEEMIFESTGENSEFDFVVMHTAELDTKCKIRVKNGTCMPIDNPQRRATADKAASQAMIDPLTYWEIMDAPNAQKYAKRLTDFTGNPTGFLSDITEEVFDRFAYTDIQYLKLGKQPPYRDELDKSYFDYLNKYILSGDLENPKIPENTRQAISQFIDMQLLRGQQMLGMAETQLPTKDEVMQHNAEVDSANAANTEATKGIPTAPPMKPTPQGSPADQGAAAPSTAV
jgi:hypothetical protein